MIITYNIKKGRNKEKCDDSALIGSKVMNDESGVLEMDAIGKVFIGDGVGGNAGGDEASLFVMNRIADIELKDSKEEMKINLIAINNALLDYAKNIPGHENMATTLTGLFFKNGRAIIAHCGNTRVYALQGSFLKQITSDQTTYQWLMSIGNAEAAENCNKSEIRGAFGGGNAKFADTLIVEDVFERGFPSIVLMTSDGIHDVLDIDEIEDIVANMDLSSTDKVIKLVDMAIEKGSMDDCTAVLIEIGTISGKSRNEK